MGVGGLATSQQPHSILTGGSREVPAKRFSGGLLTLLTIALVHSGSRYAAPQNPAPRVLLRSEFKNWPELVKPQDRLIVGSRDYHFNGFLNSVSRLDFILTDLIDFPRRSFRHLLQAAPNWRHPG